MCQCGFHHFKHLRIEEERRGVGAGALCAEVPERFLALPDFCVFSLSNALRSLFVGRICRFYAGIGMRLRGGLQLGSSSMGRSPCCAGLAKRFGTSTRSRQFAGPACAATFESSSMFAVEGRNPMARMARSLIGQSSS